MMRAYHYARKSGVWVEAFVEAALECGSGVSSACTGLGASPFEPRSNRQRGPPPLSDFGLSFCAPRRLPSALAKEDGL